MNALAPKVKEVQMKMALLAQQGKANPMDSFSAAQAIYKENGASMGKGIRNAMAQLPIFVILFFTIKKMSDNVLWQPVLAQGGTSWFTDLTVPDPYFIMPMISAFALIMTMYLQTTLTNQIPGVVMQVTMVAMSLLIILVSKNFTLAVTLYWATSGLFSVFSALLMRIPFIRSYYGIKPASTQQPQTFTPPHPIVNTPSSVIHEAASKASTEPPLLNVNPYGNKNDSRRKKKL
jgi:YidC/Oxa1 family membrane protein insertase